MLQDQFIEWWKVTSAILFISLHWFLRVLLALKMKGPPLDWCGLCSLVCGSVRGGRYRKHPRPSSIEHDVQVTTKCTQSEVDIWNSKWHVYFSRSCRLGYRSHATASKYLVMTVAGESRRVISAANLQFFDGDFKWLARQLALRALLYFWL